MEYLVEGDQVVVAQPAVVQPEGRDTIRAHRPGHVRHAALVQAAAAECSETAGPLLHGPTRDRVPTRGAKDAGSCTRMQALASSLAGRTR